jgi:2-polyprenyl-6-hydroxyphenyl methylase/3-demethylubiquinone-9 3-methyltransferase
MSEDLLDLSTHFRFGENWAGYSELVDDRRIAAARESVARLVGDLGGKSFLDIGSGSGLFSVAALRLGAGEVLATDIDPDSVATTRKLLSREGGSWRAQQVSVFDLAADVPERFDVVYSWGVLHHTGSMWRALDCAAAMVKPDGILVFALYERTPLCGAWTREKRLYRKLPRAVQKLFRGVYLTAWGAGMLAKGHNPRRYIREGRQERGMDVFHDVHDWMGGYPYESTTPVVIDDFMTKRGFERQKVVPWPVRLGGLLGSGCSEYVYRKRVDG